MARKSRVVTGSYERDDGTTVPYAGFPSGRVVVEKDDRYIVAFPSTEIGDDDTDDGVLSGVLLRKEDASGVSGTGVVADFAEFPSGRVFLEWRNEENENLETNGARDSGLDMRPSMELAVAIHGHKGRSEFLYDSGGTADPDPDSDSDSDSET